ncbi:MAG: XRE family transcriptional regulator [Firmicutes bacterium HGW-Firmicutes-16]|nr:MAG: XRE family transcriptional regulator [Firmicutes bacterium HGW-Firmicutes-16]
MDINQIISDNLKRLRMERNLSLGQLAELSTVSKVMLCQIEKGDTNPTINTIWKIANGLKVPYSALMDQAEHTASVVTKSEIAAQPDEYGHYRLFCYYANTPQRNFEVFQVELDAGYSHTTIGHPEKSQEYIMVLEGELTFTANDETFVLHQNDAISFTASAKHTYHSSGKETMKAYLINYYPA